ncbi:Protein kinase domain [Arabidopsis suecica]|uniref:Protein kinase domain n=1 Tax=Arabidopsis suecica TaxID=45249 RepID=A0A8T2BRC9_ARASU|nr:Protein kinase domain [Arabidopsis suecica]
MKIAEDIATAFAYLHTAFPRPFVYRNFSPKKIILDDDGVARLSDFSCCVSIPQGETFVKVDRIVGRFGYMDHNYKMSGLVSEKTDVFAIGIVMQKLLPEEETEEEGDISEQEIRQMKAFAMLSLRCVGLKGEVPTMVEVAKELKKIQRSLINDSSSPSGETHFDSPQDISSSSVVLSNQT